MVKKINFWMLISGIILFLLFKCVPFYNLGQDAGKLSDEFIFEESGIKGGLIVHLGCGEGRLTADMGKEERYLVHGLSPEKNKVKEAREYIQSQGIYGRVSVEHWDKEYLPYTDNLVNLLVSESLDDISMEEVMRVLVPLGVAYIKEDGEWKKKVKPWPAEIDEWTHYLHGPDNNAVAKDSRVGPPRFLQWVSSPGWLRSHEHLSSVSAVVSSGGRIFSILDKGPISFVALSSKWQLVAQDAFNGVVLWEREIGPWEYHLRGFRSGPPELNRRLVAVDDRVYVTLGYGDYVSALDAATGETVRTYNGTKNTQEIVYSEGVLYLVRGERSSIKPRVIYRELLRGTYRDLWAVPSPHEKEIMAVDARTGEILWILSNSLTAEVFPTTLCVKENRVFYQNPEEIVCLDAETGEMIWSARRPVKKKRLGWSTPTLVAYGGVVFSADRDSEGNEIKKGKEIEWETVQEEIDDEKVTWIPSSFGGNSPPGELIAFSVQNGEMLWSCECREGYNAPVDVLIADSLLWTGNLVRKTQPGFTKGRDPGTGKINKEREPDQKYYNIGMNHHRCYRNKATNRYLITSRAGVEFVDIRSGEVIPNHWVRGSCHYGILPCNGLLYTPPHPCACYSRAKLNGFNALTHELNGPPIKDDMDKRINKGPIYGRVLSFDTIISSNEWSTYRHDSRRSGYTQSTVPVDLKKRWEKELGGKLSSVVISEGKVFVSSIEAHTVYALNKENGNIEWQYTAGGRVDSPPTIYRGLCLFGAADGKVYCLRSSDGKLVWSFRAGPRNRRVVSYGQLESAWPINGSVLVEDSTVYFSAGRTSFLEEGVYLYRLDPVTGQPLSKNWIKNSYPETPEEQKSIIKNKSILVGALPDVLSSDGEFIYMRHMRFSKNLKDQRTGLPHLFSSTGFLDDSWWHRSYWVLGADMLQGFGGWKTMGNIAPSGRILNFDDSFVYGFGRDVYAVHGSHVGVDASNLLSYRPKKHKPETYYRLFRTGWDTKKNEAKQNHYWTKIIPLLVRAMVLSKNALIIAGPPDGSNLEDLYSALNSSKGGLLYLVSPSNGEKISELKLDSPPVFDGMAAADRKVYMSSLDGRIFCFGE